MTLRFGAVLSTLLACAALTAWNCPADGDLGAKRGSGSEVAAGDSGLPPPRESVSRAAADGVPARIATIQGRSHRSPVAGREVAGVSGVVTAVAVEESGCTAWLQDPVGDGDPTTSEALVVALPSDQQPLAPGDQAIVAGTVEERGHGVGLTTTTLLAAEVVVTARGRPLPAPVVLGPSGCSLPRTIDDDGLREFDPESDAIDAFEAIESMRVLFEAPLVVGPTSGYREIAVVVDGGAPLAPRTRAGGLRLTAEDPAAWPILIDDRLTPDPPMVCVGARLADVTGVLDYSFGSFKLVNTEPMTVAAPGAARPEVTDLVGDRSRLTVATCNVENLSAGSPPEKLVRVARVIAAALRGPDIVALQEIQDDSGPADDGVVGAERTLALLVDAVVAAGGPRYRWRQIDPADGANGGAPGANIRPALLYNPERVRSEVRGDPAAETGVRVEAGPTVRPNPGLLAPDSGAFAGDPRRGFDPARRPLVCELEFCGRRLFAINLHLTSKGGDDPLFGSRQPPARASEAQRLEQARLVRDLVAELLRHDPAAGVIVLGDLNEHEFRPPVQRLADRLLVNLTDRVPEDERYSYVFQGRSQQLDHILVSRSLAGHAEVDVVHVNADFPVSERASDHDPVAARIGFER